MTVSDSILYNTARAVILAVTGREYYNKDISDEQYENLIKIMRGLANHVEFVVKHNHGGCL